MAHLQQPAWLVHIPIVTFFNSRIIPQASGGSGRGVIYPHSGKSYSTLIEQWEGFVNISATFSAFNAIVIHSEPSVYSLKWIRPCFAMYFQPRGDVFYQENFNEFLIELQRKELHQQGCGTPTAH